MCFRLPNKREDGSDHWFFQNWVFRWRQAYGILERFAFFKMLAFCEQTCLNEKPWGIRTLFFFFRPLFWSENPDSLFVFLGESGLLFVLDSREWETTWNFHGSPQIWDFHIRPSLVNLVNPQECARTFPLAFQWNLQAAKVEKSK